VSISILITEPARQPNDESRTFTVLPTEIHALVVLKFTSEQSVKKKINEGINVPKSNVETQLFRNNQSQIHPKPDIPYIQSLKY
jgi:hypothetical protein